MQILFFATLVVYTAVVLGRIFIKKSYFTSATYILSGVCLPTVFYLLGWSRYITDEPSGMFYWVYISLMICSLISLSINKNKISISGSLVALKSTRSVILINMIWMFAAILNNYFVSGYFFPSFRHVDIHVQNAQFLVYFVRSTYCIIAIDILYFCISAKRWLLVLAVAQILLPILSNSSRMLAVEMILGDGSLLLFLGINGYVRKGSGRKKKKKRFALKTISILAVTVVAFGIIFIRIGIYRAGHFGVYNILYSKGIGYTGPGGETAAWLYGYFAMPCNNLNRSILAGNENPNFLGIYSFSSLYFGILRFGNLFGLKSGAAQSVSNYAVREATVPTGMWTFYYDYYILLFIPYIVAFLKELFLRQKTNYSSTHNVTWLVLYFYYIPEWFFMNFTNTIFNDTAIITGIIGFVLISSFVGINKAES